MKKVIVVEDDPIIGKVYRFHLEKAGYQVRVATDGEAGWNAIQEDVPDAVLLDLMMPRMNGNEVLRHMRATPTLQHIPVVVFTNAFIPAMVEEAKKAGANQVFDKATVTPFMILGALKIYLADPAEPSGEAKPA